MTRYGRGRLALAIISFLFLIAFSIFWRGNYRKNLYEHVEKHNAIVSESLWKIDGKTVEQYYRLAAEYNHYRDVTVYLYPDETPFIGLENSETPILYRFYRPLGLMGIIGMEAPVFYESAEIGLVIVNAYNTSVYYYSLAFILIMALYLLLNTLLRTIYLSRELEDRVRRKTEEYRLSEARYRTLVSNIPGISYRCYYGSDRIIGYISEEAERLTGYGREDFLSRRISLESLMEPEDRQAVTAAIDKSLEEKKPFMLEYRLRDKGGQVHWVYDRGQGTLRKETGDWTLEGVILDISERHDIQEQKDKLELQYRQSQKMESIGRLAGGIAHDINNMLTPVLGYADIMMSQTLSPGECRKYAGEIAAAALRARDLIGKLLTYSRQKQLHFERLELNGLIINFITFLRSIIREDITMETNLTDESTALMGDRSQLEQVLLNLVVNSRDAIKGQGRIRIRSIVKTREEIPVPETGDPEQKHYVLLEVSDNGRGMDDETREHIFEPFFSTKGTMGTGLGMSTVYGIVKQHKGFLIIDSQLEKGSTLSVFLPHSSSEREDKR